MKDETVQKEFQVEGVESQSDEGSDVYVALFQKITWDIYCKMDFTYFPVDNQVRNSQNNDFPTHLYLSTSKTKKAHNF